MICALGFFTFPMSRGALSSVLFSQPRWASLQQQSLLSTCQTVGILSTSLFWLEPVRTRVEQ